MVINCTNSGERVLCNGEYIIIDVLLYFVFTDKQLSEDASSVCSEMSDSSWVIAPSPRFRTLSTPNSTSHEALENLLIEHPTMSVYAQHAPPTSEPSNSNDNATTDYRTKNQVSKENMNARVVIPHQRQLAYHLGVSQPGHKVEALPVIPPKVKLTRKALHRQNKNYIQVTRGKKCYRIQQCVMKGGRRRLRKFDWLRSPRDCI